MLAHSNGAVLNQSTFASSMGVSVPTIKNYLDILEGTFVIRRLQPFHTNNKKRLIKSPKVYIRDSGLIHTLLNVESYNDLLGHPCLGGSFETHVIESILMKLKRYNSSFYRSSSGSEVDLVLEKGLKRVAIEIKASSTPKLAKGFYEALKVIKPSKSYCISQVDSTFTGKEGVIYTNLKSFLSEAENEL